MGFMVFLSFLYLFLAAHCSLLSRTLYQELPGIDNKKVEEIEKNGPNEIFLVNPSRFQYNFN